ncbi:hypothetical protein NGA_0474600, partial [Nannochloropsis gaditana CCMP526]
MQVLLRLEHSVEFFWAVVAGIIISTWIRYTVLQGLS